MDDPTDNARKSTGYNDPATGRFVSGPANKGRPKGSKNRVSRAAMEKIKELGPLAFEKLQENLDRGDMRAVEFVLNRVLPAGRALEIDATVEGIRDHLENGDFSESEARAIANVMEKLQRVEKVEELERRLNELTALLKDGSL